MKTFKYTFTEEEANLILQALVKGSFEVVYRLVANIQNQTAAQMAPKPKKVKEVADVKTV